MKTIKNLILYCFLIAGIVCGHIYGIPQIVNVTIFFTVILGCCGILSISCEEEKIRENSGKNYNGVFSFLIIPPIILLISLVWFECNITAVVFFVGLFLAKANVARVMEED